MKVILFTAFLLAPFVLTAPAEAYNGRQVEVSYRACMQFLKMPAAKQRAVAARAGIPLSRAKWGCELQRRNGLAKSKRLEREYQRAKRDQERGGGYSSPSAPDSGPQSCSGNISCGGGQHCVDRICVDKSQRCAESGMFQCSTGNKCVNGVCE